jgi:hypothetical protein
LVAIPEGSGIAVDTELVPIEVVDSSDVDDTARVATSKFARTAVLKKSLLTLMIG